MSDDTLKPSAVLKRLGRVGWNKVEGAFIVRTEDGATLHLCPNSDEDLRAGIHVDEIDVAEGLRRKGAATKAMLALCRLADEHKLVLKGGPVGWSDDPWGEKFVAWIRRLGFERDPFPPTIVHDRTAFYARRLPKPLKKNVPRL